MAVRSVIQAAITSLRNAIGNGKKHKAHLNELRDAFKQVEGDGLSNAELSEHCTSLAQVLSETIPGLHKSRARPTLVFCGAALSWLFKAKLEPALEKRDAEGATIWEDTIFQGLMQPILNAVDSEDQDLGDVGDTLYRGICEMMCSSWSESFGGRFARSLALVLVYTCSSSKNKAMLLDSNIFGTTALAKLIVDAKDYHHLDTLLELSFTMFSSQGGKVSRKAYADSIFANEYALEKLPENICNEIASIHAVTSGDNSEKHVLDIMRAMSGAGIDRPQVFMTQDLSYCGTRYTQRSPNNVMVLDYGAVCVIICDKDKESDVLTVSFTEIQSIEVTPQDGSRVLVEFAIAGPPLISSTREEVATPDSHIPGSPLQLRVSIASSDVFGLEAALAARNLAGILRGHIALTRNSSLASVKISNAISSIALKKTNNDQADDPELWRKYVNLPSSTCASPSGPPSAAIAQPVVEAQAGSHKPHIPHATAPAPVPKRPVPKRAPEPQEEIRPEPAVSDRVAEPALPSTRPAKRPRSTAAKPSPLPTEQIERAPSPNCTGQEDFRGVGDSEPTDVDANAVVALNQPQSEAQPVADSPPQAQDAPLPTPPRTRARAQQTKPVAKILVPATPIIDRFSDEPPASALPSPSPKPTRKRRRIEDDPIELPPLNPERPAKQTKSDGALTGSQHIIPRNTTATRARAKYGAANRKRVSSPESIHSADTDGLDSAAPKNLKAPACEDPVSSGEEVNENQPEAPSRATKNDMAPRAKRPTRAAAITKAKLVATKAAKAPVQNGPTEQMADSEGESTSVPEKPKPRRGRPPKNKQKLEQETVEQPGRSNKPSQLVEPSAPSPKPTSIQEQPANSSITEKVPTVNPEPTPAASVHEAASESQGNDSEEDDLLKRLSQAAKKAARTPFVDHQSTQLRPPSPTKNVGLPIKDSHVDEDVDVETIDHPEPVAGPSLPEPTLYPTRTTAIKTFKTAKVVSATSHSASSAKEAKSTDAPAETPKETSTSEVFMVDNSQTQAPPATTSTKQNTPNDTRASGNHAAESPVDNMGSQMDVTSATQPAAAPSQEQSREPAPEPASRVLSTKPPESPTVEEIPEIVEPPKTPMQRKPGKTERRIQPTQVQNVGQTPSQRDATPPKPKYLRHAKSRIAFISIDSTNSDTEMDNIQDFAPENAKMEPVQAPSLLATTPSILPARQKIPKSQLTLVPEGSKAKHAAVTRVLFTNQPSPKSALASPQRRTLANGVRPSVSFLDPPVGPLLRRGSSGSSAGAERRRQQEIEREKLLEGKSERTGAVIIQIIDELDRIQAFVASNVAEKVQTVTTEARNARAELINVVIAELDSLRSESEIYHDALHDLESAFATQAQAMLKGLGRVDECNARIGTQAEKMLRNNARVGQGIAEAVVNFQLPEEFAGFLATE